MNTTIREGPWGMNRDYLKLLLLFFMKCNLFLIFLHILFLLNIYILFCDWTRPKERRPLQLSKQHLGTSNIYAHTLHFVACIYYLFIFFPPFQSNSDDINWKQAAEGITCGIMTLFLHLFFHGKKKRRLSWKKDKVLQHAWCTCMQ